MAYAETNRPLSAIFADLVNQLTALVRKESQLARAEMSEKIGELGMALGRLRDPGRVAPQLAFGINRLKAARLVPSRTVEQLRRDAAVATQQMRNDYGIPERAA